MFITFGLSSFLKWARSFEAEQEEENSIFKTELTARIAAAFAERGFDPDKVMPHVNSCLHGQIAEEKSVPFPIAKIVDGVVKTVGAETVRSKG